jgi:hypothetical protein
MPADRPSIARGADGETNETPCGASCSGLETAAAHHPGIPSTTQDLRMNRLLALASLTLALVGAPAFAQTAPQVKDFDLFVDLPTGFAFIKMPAGWKFVGKLEADQMRNLPATTLTSLLPPDEDSVRTARPSHPAASPAPRGKAAVAVAVEG